MIAGAKDQLLTASHSLWVNLFKPWVVSSCAPSTEAISELFRVHHVEIVGLRASTLEPTQTLLLAFLAFHSVHPVC